MHAFVRLPFRSPGAPPRSTEPPSRGFTLLEVAAALLLMGVSLGIAVPRVRALVDRSAVLGAREALVGLVGEARVRAVAHGGATVWIRTRPATALLEAGGDSVRLLRLEEDFGVALAFPGTRTQVALRFDGLGLGRVSSETVRITRNGREARMVVSAYGRVRRR